MRPPELLTRDVVAKAIMKEVKEGRGSPHGGAFLDIANRRDPDYIKKKLPSMYHQFKELGDLDITDEPMEVGPTTHYMMGGIRVNAETGESTLNGICSMPIPLLHEKLQALFSSSNLTDPNPRSSSLVGKLRFDRKGIS